MSARLTITIPVWLDKIFTLPLLAFRLLRYGYTFRRIPVGEGHFAIVDPKDFYRLNNFNWSVVLKYRCYYAIRFLNVGKGKLRMISMHRDIMNAPKGSFVDHRNNNGLDNRRDNLRFATSSENMQNRRKTLSKTSSRFTGVCLKKETGRWYAYIRANNKRMNLGYFDSEIEAARAYDQAAVKHHGEFARLNFPEENRLHAVR